jgi:DNA repair protein RecN (Recombination protein N)
VIRSLEVRDLVVISRAELSPPAGLTAITGETGAGKTVLTQALGLLAGAPADAAAVRAGARHALVQATIALPAGFWDRLDEDDPASGLRDLVEDEREVVIARRVPAEGRARALIDGQAAPRDAVASLARAMLRFSAQHEHRRLVGAASQLAILDAFAGTEAVAAAERLAALGRHLRSARRAVAAARARRDAAARAREELAALVDAVDGAALDPAEEDALRRERERLRHAESLARAVAGAAEALAPADDSAGAVELAGEAVRLLEPVRGVDPELAGPVEDISGALAALQEAVLFVRSYLHDLDAEPGRLEQVDDRLDEYQRLRRRFDAPDTPALIERADAAREDLRALDQGDGELAALEADLAASLGEARGLAAALRERREEAAPRLAGAVGEQLAELGMARAELRVEVGEAGGDPPAGTCVMWLRANPGLPEAPLAATASGGELSRVLLALNVVAAGGDGAAWVMDEVDAGIGGVTATAVASRLRAMAQGRQVIVITHLPQVAAMADAHYRLVKGVDDAGVATTTIEAVAGDELVAELCRMLGASAGDEGARRHAQELLTRRDG